MRIHGRLRVAAEAHAVPLEHVLEVAGLDHVWAVPGARPELLSPDRLLVAETGGRRAGFAIHEVSRVAPRRAPAEETESGLLLDTALPVVT